VHVQLFKAVEIWWISETPWVSLHTHSVILHPISSSSLVTVSFNIPYPLPEDCHF
jgi:hypothetical protein